MAGVRLAPKAARARRLPAQRIRRRIPPAPASGAGRTATETWAWSDGATQALATPNRLQSYPSGDGFVRNTGTSSWATLRAAAAGTLADTAADSFPVQADFSDSVNRYIDRGFLAFDTSAIPDGNQIVSAVLYLAASSKFGGTSDYICLVAGTQASATTLATSDFGNVGATELAARKSIADFNVGAYTAIELNAAGRAAISTTGTTKFALRTSQDVDNAGPAAGATAYVNITASEHAGLALDPLLIVEYAAVPGTVERWAWTDGAATYYWRPQRTPTLVRAEGANTQLNGDQPLNGSTITVLSTSGFPSSGTIYVIDTADSSHQSQITYTGKTATTFTGCTGGSATTYVSGSPVGASDAESHFPSINALEDTTNPRLLATYTQHYAHSGGKGRIRGKISTDGGTQASWNAATERTLVAGPVDSSTWAGIYGHTCLRCSDGSLFVAWYEQDMTNRTWLRCYTVRGTPDGAGWFTFDAPVQIPSPFHADSCAMGFQAFEYAGDVYLPVYGTDNSPYITYIGDSYVKLMKTTDKGATSGGWSTVGTVATEAQLAGLEASECHIVILPTKWIAAIRYESAHKSRIFAESTDAGVSWSGHTVKVDYHANDPAMHVMPEGHVVLQGQEQRLGGGTTFGSTVTWVSTDDGNTFPAWRAEETDATYSAGNGSQFKTLADTSVPSRRVVNAYSQERPNQGGAQVKFQWYAVDSFPLATETWGWTDGAGRSVTDSRTAINTWTWSDSATGGRAAGRTANETWSWAESATQSTAHGYTRTAAETWAWSDNTARAALTYTRGASEAWAWTDGVSRVVSSVNGDPSIVLHTMLAAGATLGAYLVREWKGQILSKWNPTPGMLQATATVDDWGLAPFYGLAPDEYVAWSPERPRERIFFAVT